MNPFFSQLGQSVYDLWKAKDFRPALFPEIAKTCLQKFAPSKRVNLDDLISNFLLDDRQPYQTSSGFGQPELIVYENTRFYIQILFWLDGTTDIHQHGFSGAFHVLAGSSIHSSFSFTQITPVTSRFQLGNLILKETQLLESGTTVMIHSGPSCIHSLFHLETPSVTVVIRTHSDPGSDPQFTYLPPHVGLDPVNNDALTTRRKQLLDVLEVTGNGDYGQIVVKMLKELDFERGFFILQNCVSTLRNLGCWEKAWAVFLRKHGPMALPVLPTLEEIIRRDGIAALRASVEDVEHRFFLALLLNVGNREDILKIISSRFEGSPLATISRWGEELLRITESGTWLVDALFPSEIGNDETCHQGVFLAAMNHFICGQKPSPELRRLSKTDLESLGLSLHDSSWRNLLPGKRSSSSKK